MNYAYRLTIVGDDETLRAYKASSDARTELNKVWDPSQPFILRRRYFPTFPRVLRVSRKHLEIHCEEVVENGQSTRSFSVSDISTNGTWCNGSLLEKGVRVRIKSGDELLIINDEMSDGSTIRFGFLFTIFEEDSAPKTSQPPAQYIHEFKQKAKVESEERMRTRQKRRNREFELSESDEERRAFGKRRTTTKKGTDSENEFAMRATSTRSKKTDFQEEEMFGTEAVKQHAHEEPSTVQLPKKTDRIMKQWTPEEEQRLIEIMASSEGKSWKEIAVHFPHRSPDAVRNKFKKMSETDKVAKSFWAATISKQQARAAALAAAVTASTDETPASLDTTQEPYGESKDSNTKEHEVPVVHVKETVEEEDRRRKIWTPEEDEQLKQLILKYRPQTNEEWELIAGELGRTVKSVKHKFNDHNLRHLLD